MAEQQRRQSGRAPQRRADAPADQYGLGLNMSLLDWNQLEPLGEAEAMAAADQDLDFLPDLANDLLDEGTDDEALSEQSLDSDGERMQLRGGRKDPQGQGGAPVVTTGVNTDSSPTAQGPSAVTTGQVPSRRTRAGGRASARRGRRSLGPSASASSGSGTQPAGTSADPSAEPSGSGESGKPKRKKPTPNLDDIDDPVERRKQRRLAKNRATAAVSRERKRVQMIQLAARTRALEQENANLQFMLGLRDHELGKLRSNLASLPRGAREGEPRTNDAAAASPSEPAVLTGTAHPLGSPHADAYAPAPQPAHMLAPSAMQGVQPASGGRFEQAGQQSGQLNILQHPGQPSAGQQSGQPGNGLQSGPPNDERIAPERGNNESLPGMELDHTVSLQGSSEPIRVAREHLQRPLEQRPPLLMNGLPIEIVNRGMSANIPGIIVGSDGQWLRLKQRSATSPCTSQPPRAPPPHPPQPPPAH